MKKIYYVVSEHEDGSNAYAVRFEGKAAAKKFLYTEEDDFRTRELFTEDEFMDQWTLPEDYFPDEDSAEEEAEKEGYYWDDDLECWTCVDIRDESELWSRIIRSNM